MISKVTVIAIVILNQSLGQTIANPTADTKLMQDYEKFMDAYCGETFPLLLPYLSCLTI
jgi:hypothetical protein